MVHDLRRSNAAHLTQADHSPPPTANVLGADDGVESPVAPLRQYVRSECSDQSERRVFAEQHHPIDARECAEHFGALPGGYDGTPRTLEASHAGVGVDADNQTVSEVTGLSQASNVADMQEVETAVRKDDPLTESLRLTDAANCGTLFEHLVLGRCILGSLSPGAHDSLGSAVGGSFVTSS